MTKTVAFIQARMSSSRFPGKVLADLDGRPLIQFMVERVRRATTLDEVAVITSVDESDDPLAEALSQFAIPVFRGDLDDVLNRYMQAAATFGATTVVRLTGDCPLVDPAIIDMVVSARGRSGADYASNTQPPSFADGLDVECFTRAALEAAALAAATRPEREHVTLWMRAETTELRRVNVRGLIDSSHLRLTVDYPDDLEMLRQMIALLGSDCRAFDHFDMLKCLSNNPHLLEMNRHQRNEGLAISLQDHRN